MQHSEKRGFSITEFCESYGFCRATYYNLKKEGKAPKTIEVRRREIITPGAADEWEKAMSTSSKVAA